MQAIVLQEDGGRLQCLALVANVFFRLLESGLAAVGQGDQQLVAVYAVAFCIDMRAIGQRCCFVEKGTGEGHNFGTAHRVVARAFFRTFGFSDGIGAIQRVIQRAPAGVRGVQGVAGIHRRHHQLRAGLAADLDVDVGGAGLHVGRLRLQVAD